MSVLFSGASASQLTRNQVTVDTPRGGFRNRLGRGPIGRPSSWPRSGQGAKGPSLVRRWFCTVQEWDSGVVVVDDRFKRWQNDGMLRVVQSTRQAQARSYYTSSDYYSEGQERAGHWGGKAASMLGLSGEVKQEDWEALCDNRDPVTGDRLTQRQKKNRTPGYDFNFHVCKSLSLLFAETGDERLLAAIQGATDETMHVIETEMATRVRQAGRQENRITGNMAYGSFLHLTARPMAGVPDPHCHVHVFVHNVTFDPVEQRWKAGQFRGLKERAPYFEAFFQSRLARRLEELGLPINRTSKSWELAGVDQTFREKFSRRTSHIEQQAEARGITDPAAKSELGARTRERKQKELTFRELQALWRQRMSSNERQVLAKLGAKLDGNDSSGNFANRRKIVPPSDDDFITDTIRRHAFFAARALANGRHVSLSRGHS